MVVHKCNKERELGEIQRDIKYIRTTVDEIKAETNLNTKFRNQAMGIISAVGFVGGAVGAGAVWVFNKIRGG